MSLQFALFIIALVANVSLGLLVYISNTQSWTNRFFFLLISSMNIWAFFNVVSTQNPGNVITARIVLLCAVVFALFFYLFAITYPETKLTISTTWLKRLGLWAVSIMALTLSPLVFKQIEMTGSGLGKPIVAPGIALFAVTVMGFDAIGLFRLLAKYKRSTKAVRAQRLLLITGISLMLITIIVLNFIFPAVIGNTRFIPYASVFMLPFVAFTTYAIIRHQLLDIRGTVARAVAYILSLGSLGIVYGGVIYGVSTLLSGNNWYKDNERLFYIGLALLTSLIYERIVKFFNRMTNKVFYQDAYDSAVLIDELNKVIVGNVYLQLLLRSCATIISDTLKVQHCTFVISKTNEQPTRLFGDDQQEFNSAATEEIVTFESFATRLITNHEDMSVSHPKTAQFMRRHQLAIVARLGSSTSPQGVLGYMLVGEKKSGNLFNRQDKTNLGIIANELTVAIQNAMRFEEIQGFNVTLQAKVNQATHQLKLANDKLVALNDTKDDFISMASHQLRTPLTSVKGNISMIMDEDFGKVPAGVMEPLGQAYASSERMVGLIADLLNVSRLRTGKFAIQPTPSNLDDVVKSELKQLKEAAKAHKLELTYDGPPSFPTLMMDEIKIRQVIMNFIDNAIYYTPAGGHIKVTLRKKQSAIEFTVEDDGIGVPRDMQHHLFNKFYRAGNAQKMRPDGTGIGLFMAKKVIIASGGAIIFKSTEGKGSTFGFTIPLSKLPKPPQNTEPAQG